MKLADNKTKATKKSLAEARPDIAKQWHPTKNGNLTPKDVTCGLNKKVWWFYPYDDPRTGKHFNFEWPAGIADACKGTKCPFLSGRAIWKGYNDLATTNPELAAQWHPTKNNGLTPEDFTSGSGKEVWWLYPYDDARTGKHFDFEWPAQIRDRSKRGHGCPFLSGQQVWKGFNDLATTKPELAAQWHPTKNGDLTPFDVTCGANKKVWWLYPYDDPRTGKRFNLEWKAKISDRNKLINDGQQGCPFLKGLKVLPGFNDLATTNPELASQWHPTKNGTLTPTKITEHYNEKVWWLYPYDDPKTGKHFDFEWEARVSNRSRWSNCPFLSGRAIWKGFNDLATTHPELADQWHPTKNGNLTPEEVSAGSQKKVWWLFARTNPDTGEQEKKEWYAGIADRVLGSIDPFLIESVGEQNVKKYLNNKKYKFEYSKKFDKLKGVSGGTLSYDFHLEKTDILIEFQGKQHYEVVEFFGGKEKLKIQKTNDRRKRRYAKKNGYHLIEINYKHNTYEKVASYLDEHLLPLLA